jgi:hypothetical protein
MSLDACRIIELPKIGDPRGNLTFLEGGVHVPFEIRRVFYLYDVPGGETRAGHALRTCEQVILAISGSFNVTLKDGTAERRYQLNRSNRGLYLPAKIWRELDDFSSGAVCLVLASERYEETGYYRDFDSYLAAVSAGA